MSTSTSPTSDPVVLFWGDTWWLPGRGEPLPVSDSSQAAAVLAAGWPGEHRRLRLLYEPNGFRSESVDCPRANRSTMGWALSDRFPELAEPDRGWSHEPIRACDDGFVTLLHLEAEPGLVRLVNALQQAGLTVTEVWPVPTWLQMLPDDLSDSGGGVTGLLGRDRVCVYHESSDGSRAVERWQGAEALHQCEIWLHDRRARYPDDPVRLVSESPTLLAEFGAVVSGDETPHVEVMALPDALDQEAVFPSRHPAQMLPRRPRFTGGALIAAASWVVLLTTVSWSGMIGWSWYQERGAAARDQPALSALQSEVAQRQANAAEIARLQALVTPDQTVIASDLLAALVRDLPPDIVFDRFDAQASGLRVDGWTKPESAGLAGWFEQLKAARPEWEWSLAPTAGGAFQLEARSL